MASTSSRLPTEIIGRVMHYVSHPCADLIRQLGLVHEHPARTQTYTSEKLSQNYVFTDGHNDSSGWYWAHHYAHLREGKSLWSHKRACKIHFDVLVSVSDVFYRYDISPMFEDDDDEDDDDEDDDDEDDDEGWDEVYGCTYSNENDVDSAELVMAGGGSHAWWYIAEWMDDDGDPKVFIKSLNEDKRPTKKKHLSHATTIR